MAGPGQFNVNITGQDSFFLNSDDNKIKITGYAPTADVAPSGNVYPTTGSLTTSGSDPKLSGIAWPTTYALTFSGTQPVTGEPRIALPTLGTLALSGKVPTLGRNPIPGTASLTITEFSPARWTGLWFEGNAPTTVVSAVYESGIDPLVLQGYAPDVAVVLPGNQVRIPEVGSLSFASDKIVSSEADSLTVPLGSIAITGRLSFVTKFAYPGTKSLGLTGYAPAAVDEFGQPIVIIEGPFEYGTFIRNTNAEADAANRYNICARSGYRAKPGELVKDGYGEWVLPEYADRKHPSDLGQGSAKGRYRKGALRPSDIGSETFIDPDNPVSADDL